ncbi:pantoate-beta-alanine ligase [Apiospora sp. TS-2023a]
MFARTIRRAASSRAAATTFPTPAAMTMPRCSSSPRPTTTMTTSPTIRTMASSSSSARSPKLSSRETIPSTRIRILRSVDSVRAWRKPHQVDQRIVSLVPTMGALHEGHLSLIRAAARESHEVVVSIYVNPAQFGVHEDLDSYPKTWETDCAALAQLDRELADDGANLGRLSAVFAPTTNDMYPSGFPGQAVDSKGSFVNMTPVGELFNVVQPDRVYFGQKDVQQTVVIRRMVRDFLMPIEVQIGATTREADGLALSSRNVYLGERRRRVATVLNRALKAAEGQYSNGRGARDRDYILGAARKVMTDTLAEQMALAPEKRVMFEVDYISLSDPETMEEISEIDPKKGGILSGAVKMLPVEAPRPGEDLGHSGGPAVRLIDNIILKPSST